MKTGKFVVGFVRAFGLPLGIEPFGCWNVVDTHAWLSRDSRVIVSCPFSCMLLEVWFLGKTHLQHGLPLNVQQTGLILSVMGQVIDEGDKSVNSHIEKAEIVCICRG